MIKSIRISTFVLCLLSFGSPVSAEPTPSVQALMNQDVSLFSFGLYQLNERITKQEVSGLKGLANASYDWKSNRLRLVFHELQKPGFCVGKNDLACRSACERQYKSYRDLLCYGENCKTVNLFSSYFSHIGYSRNVLDQKSDATVAESLKDITEIEIRLKLSEDYTRVLVCEGPITREQPGFRTEDKK